MKRKEEIHYMLMGLNSEMDKILYVIDYWNEVRVDRENGDLISHEDLTNEDVMNKIEVYRNNLKRLYEEKEKLFSESVYLKD